jgi:broad specificity phosphatase PhoE
MPSLLLKAATARRRIYLMRHGAVDYIGPDGKPVDPDAVPLSEAGRGQAQAAGRLFKQGGVQFDHVLTSGLPRTDQTAQHVLAEVAQPLPLRHDIRLQEIRPGPPGGLSPEQLVPAFLNLFDAGADFERQRFIGGESIGEMLDRVLPAFEELLQRSDWHNLLLVLHGAVNRALLARAMTGGRGFFGRLEQAPACINVIDVGQRDLVVRSTNLNPSDWLQPGERLTTMERLLGQFLKSSQPS